MIIPSKLSGALYGHAIGDALGYPVEFLSVPEILQRFGREGVLQPKGNPILVSDDTQMSIAVGKALMDCWEIEEDITATDLSRYIRKYFIEWMLSPDNNRAPGNTCMWACRNLQHSMTWQEATHRTSKGCGANMRVIPVALFKYIHPSITHTEVAKWAQLQAAMTHGHPTALAAADLTAMAVVKLLEGTSPEQLLKELVIYGESQIGVYHEDYLGSLWEGMKSSPAAFIRQGWEECLEILVLTQIALMRTGPEHDPCEIIGEGWIAEETLGTALLCFLHSPRNPLKALQQAAISTGDSDSIACITGALCGAYMGIEAFPEDWRNRIEYKNELDTFLGFLGL